MSTPASPAAASPRQLPRNGPSGARNLTPYHHPSSHPRHTSSSHSGTATPTTGSATQTITDTSSRASTSPDPLVLRLRGAHDATTTRQPQGLGHRRRITWAEDVIDNEGLGRKSSKVCCIYHRAREVGESSDESSSESDDSSSDSEGSESADDGAARMVGGGAKGHKHGKGCGHSHGHGHAGSGKRKPSPNAYERMPKYMKERTGGES